jgi:hypothetical protein
MKSMSRVRFILSFISLRMLRGAHTMSACLLSQIKMTYWVILDPDSQLRPSDEAVV